MHSNVKLGLGRLSVHELCLSKMDFIVSKSLVSLGRYTLLQLDLMCDAGIQ